MELKNANPNGCNVVLNNQHPMFLMYKSNEVWLNLDMNWHPFRLLLQLQDTTGCTMIAKCFCSWAILYCLASSVNLWALLVCILGFWCNQHIKYDSQRSLSRIFHLKCFNIYLMSIWHFLIFKIYMLTLMRSDVQNMARSYLMMETNWQDHISWWNHCLFHSSIFLMICGSKFSAL